MKFSLNSTTFIMTIGFLLSVAGGNSAHSSESEVRSIIVQLKQTPLSFSPQALSKNELFTLNQDLGITLSYKRRLFNSSLVLNLPRQLSYQDLKGLIDRLNSHPQVEYAYQDHLIWPTLTPDDQRYTDQWHYHNERGGIGTSKAWDITTGSSDLVVAVVDTGILEHPDISERLVPGYDFISDSNLGSDGDGWDDDPSDPGTGSCDAESSWHGLHVAGTIAATTNNSLGVSGINWHSRVLPVRTLSDCGGTTSDLISAIRWAAGLSVEGVSDNPYPAKVINLSLGGEGSCPTDLQTAIDQVTSAGSLIVVAAGNEDIDLGTTSYFPASCTNVVTVAATTTTGNKASYSNYGSRIDVSAPGGTVSVVGDPNGVLSLGNAGSGEVGAFTYTLLQGTSMAAPHVAGVASLLMSLNSNLTPANVTNLLKSSARNFPFPSDCTTSICGDGIIDAEAALIAAKGSLSSTPSQLRFTNVESGASSNGQTLTWTNHSNSSSATLGSATFTGLHKSDFQVLSDTCSGQTLAPGASCKIVLSFSPAASGPRHASLYMNNDQNAMDRVALFAEAEINRLSLSQDLNEDLLNDRRCAWEEAARGTELESKLYVLRSFRDQYLLKTSLGQLFIQSYYDFSPTLARQIRQHPKVKQAMVSLGGFLTHMIESLTRPFPPRQPRERK